jgi:hypothetical protein
MHNYVNRGESARTQATSNNGTSYLTRNKNYGPKSAFVQNFVMWEEIRCPCPDASLEAQALFGGLGGG